MTEWWTGCRSGTWGYDEMLGSGELLGLAEDEVVGSVAFWALIAEIGASGTRFPAEFRKSLASADGSLGTGWGISSIVFSMVTGPLMLVALVEPLMRREYCDVKFADIFVFKDGAADIVGAPGTELERLRIVADAEVRGDPRAACNPAKLCMRIINGNFMLASTCGVESGRITAVGHFAFSDGSAPVNRSPSAKR